MKIHQLPVMEDNFIYVLERSGRAAVVDPGVSEPVLKFLQEKNLLLETILITHHHSDHIRGVPQLQAAFPQVEIHGSKKDSRISFAQRRWQEGDCFSLFGEQVVVWEMDGHTIGHIAYYFPKPTNSAAGVIFSGDVLFSLGCGKLFEGNAEQMWHSLSRMRDLPEATRVFGSHEYTLENSRFALQIDPDNRDLREMVERARELRSRGESTVPTTLGEEKRANPFLRPEALQGKLGLTGKPIWQVFQRVREAKDRLDRGEAAGV
jgi:hydroxyacylglutathione hydrolase